MPDLDALALAVTRSALAVGAVWQVLGLLVVQAAVEAVTAS